MPTIQKQSDPDIKPETIVGFLGGLNDFQDETVIKDSELTRAQNIILDVDGLAPRPGTESYGTASGDKVLGLSGFYKSDGTRKFVRYASGLNNKLQYYDSGTWTDIGSTTYDSSETMNFVQARDKLFIFNGADNLSFYDGSSITTYTQLSTPTGLTVAAQGTTGSTTYSYRVSAFNDAGETLGSTSVSISNGNATLSASNYNKLDWDTDAGATGWNIYGREATGLGETYMATVYTNQYLDKGQDDPTFTILPPEANTTAGITAKQGVFGISRIFAAGDTNYPSRLYFSGVGDRVTDFSWSEIGGGYIDVYKDDGYKITAIKPFQGGIIVFKENAIYKFSFADDGTQLLEEITRSFGAISFRSVMHVENDLLFAAKKDGRLAFYSLGNQENYAGSILRTNELSVKIENSLRNVNTSKLEDSASFYYRNIFGTSVATSGSSVNDRTWCLDTRFGAWVYWDGFDANCFANYIDSDGGDTLYFGDDSDGDVVEMFTTAKSDRGAATSVNWATKAFNQKVFHKYKDYYDPVVQFKDVTVSGAITGDIIVDGALINASFVVNTVNTGGAGIGYGLFGATLFGQASGGTPSPVYSSDQVVEIDSNQTARSIKYEFRSSTAGADYKFLGISHMYSILSDMRLNSDYRNYAT